MKKYSLWIILGITFLYAIGMTIVFPLFPFLLGRYLPASQIVLGLSVLVSVYAACQFFAAPVFGALSDRFGRRPVLIASLIGSVIGYLLLGIGGALWVLLLGRVIDGITAGDITALLAYRHHPMKPHQSQASCTGSGFCSNVPPAPGRYF
jgi:DHA1 family tetracycline resistance protein-like MFS transporter